MSFHLQDQQGKEKSKGQFNIEILPCTCVLHILLCARHLGDKGENSGSVG